MYHAADECANDNEVLSHPFITNSQPKRVISYSCAIDLFYLCRNNKNCELFLASHGIQVFTIRNFLCILMRK